ncbi:MAG: hypothetical protein KAT65_29565, partial [Methanophagales archaeon]|nr:hypothetical protein [Methanophagales archaeon]
PCSLATIFAGLFGGIIYVLRKGKFIGVLGAVVFAALMEFFHMILILLLAQPYSKAVMVVEVISVPMIVSNSLGMAIFTFIVSNLIRGQETAERREEEKRL